MSSLLERFFTDERERDYEIQVAQAHEIVAWASMPYHVKFLEWLETESNQKIPIGDNTTMIRGIERSNTLRELLTKLRRDAQRAADAIKEM